MSGETESNISGWTVDTLHAHVDQLLNALERRLLDRNDLIEAAQDKAVKVALITAKEAIASYDRRYEERFTAQEKAVNSALTAAKEAVSKAEVAAEKRFDSVNEFRAQLSDQASTFLPRLEGEQRINTLAERLQSNEVRSNESSALITAQLSDKIDAINKQLDSRFTTMAQNFDSRLTAMVGSIGAIASRIDRTEGRSTGLNAGWGYLVGSVGFIFTILAIIGFFSVR